MVVVRGGFCFPFTKYTVTDIGTEAKKEQGAAMMAAQRQALCLVGLTFTQILVDGIAGDTKTGSDNFNRVF